MRLPADPHPLEAGRPLLFLTPSQARRVAARVEVLMLTSGLNRSPRWWCEHVIGLSGRQARPVLTEMGES